VADSALHDRKTRAQLRRAVLQSEPGGSGLFVSSPALVVIDIQQDMFLPSDASGIERAAGQAEVITNAERILEAARAGNVPVIFTQEAHRRTGIDFGRELDGSESVHCIEDEPSTALWPTLTPRHGEAHEYLVVKRRYSAFFGTDFDILLRGLHVGTLVLIGNLTDVCVHYTFVDAHQHDYHVRVVEDCVVGSSTSRHDAALDAMEYLQHGARVVTEAVVDAFTSRTDLSGNNSRKNAVPELTEVGT
jgi:nicotinamidase-related amidase